MPHWTASLFSTALGALSKKRAEGGGGFGTVLRSIGQFPIKVVAAFVLAPFLAFRVARIAKNPIRRIIAGTGLFLAICLGWLAGTSLGTAAGALLIYSKFGIVWGLAFLIGSFLSVTLSVAFSILVLNATAFFFLRVSSEEVIEYLRRISE